MKPRVLFSDGELRVVKLSPWSFTLEKCIGKDAMQRGVWHEVKDGDANTVHRLVRTFGKSMLRREKAMRKARRGRS